MSQTQEKAWISTSEQRPPDGLVVDTKIDDEKGIRNEQQLRSKSRMWYYPDADMYVYTTPTHWKYTNQ